MTAAGALLLAVAIAASPEAGAPLLSLRAPAAAEAQAPVAPAAPGPPPEPRDAAPPSVYRLHPLDPLVIALGAAAIWIPYGYEDSIIDMRCPCDPNEIPEWERFAIHEHSDAADTASTATLGVALVLPPLAELLAIGWGRPWLEDVVVLSETLFVSGGLVTLVKYATQRPIPRAYAGDPAYLRKPGSYRSFYSGHTTLTFSAVTAAAFTARLRWGERVWPWILAGAIGTSVAIERVAAGQHFPSDVIVGAAVGAAVGFLVPFLHVRADRALALVPARGGVALAGTW
jgi:membrane-associated phospholipid phosphatase